MKKSTKGALAAGAAAVLLLGGAGTLAYWTATDTVDGGVLESGNLSLALADCADWVYATADDLGTGEAVTLIVPGDTIEKTCTGTVTGAGDHLYAEIALDQDSVDDTLSLLGAGGTTADTLTVTAAQTAPATGPIEVTAGGVDVEFTVTVAYPYGTENNDSQNATTAALDGLTVVATQVHEN